MLKRVKKEKIIEKFRTHKHDTGSSVVQIAILTAEVKELTKHLKDHKKDYSSRRGLLRKVSQRRRLLRFLQKDDEKSFIKIIKTLKLKAPRIEEVAEIPEPEIKAEEEEVKEEEVKEKE